MPKERELNAAILSNNGRSKITNLRQRVIANIAPTEPTDEFRPMAKHLQHLGHAAFYFPTDFGSEISLVLLRLSAVGVGVAVSRVQE